ncbi:MAG: hypothetical protein ACH37Z_03295 [Anaerolineae bacterium]
MNPLPHPSRGRRASATVIGTATLLVGLAVSPAIPEPARSQAQQPLVAPYALEATWPLPPRDFGVEDLAVAADGTVAVADWLKPRILIYAPDSSLVGTWDPPCPTRQVHMRLTVSPDGATFVAVGSCDGRHFVATRSADGQTVTPPAMISIPIGFLGDVAMAADGQLLAMGAFRLAWLDPATGKVSRYDTLGEAVATARRLAALPDGGVVLLFPDGHLERYDGGGVRRASAALADARLTLVDLVAEASGDILCLVARAPRGSAIPTDEQPLLARFSTDLRLLGTERPRPAERLLVSPNIGFGAQVLHRSAGGTAFASFLWSYAVHRLTDDGTLRRVSASAPLPQSSFVPAVALPPPPPPRLPLAWVDGKLWMLDGRVWPPDLLELSPTGARRLGAEALTSPYLDLAPAPGGGAWLSGADGIDHWSPAAGRQAIDLACDCPDGGRIAAMAAAGSTQLFQTRPHLGQVRVLDADLRAAAGSIALPEPAGLWPADLAATPRGELLTADAATGEVQRWSPGGRLLGGWQEVGPGAGPRRVAAAAMASGADRAALLNADGRLVLRELPEGRWLGDMVLPLPQPEGIADDLTIAPDGRVFVSDLGAGAIHLFDPVAGALPTPGGAPSPTPTPSDRPCRIHRDKTVGPTKVVLGQTATISLTLAADCGNPGRQVGADLVLLLDNNELPKDRRLETYPGANLSVEIEAAKAFLRTVDSRRHRVGLVAVDGRRAISMPLGSAPALLMARLDSLGPAQDWWPSFLSQQLDRAERLLRAARPDALRVLVLITDLSTTNPDDHLWGIWDGAEASAARLLDQGVVIHALLVARPGLSEQLLTSARLRLSRLTGSLQRVQVVSAAAQVEPVVNAIYSQVRALAGASLSGSLTIHDEMAADIALLPGTADGEPLEGPQWLIWRRGLLPASGITLSYRIRPLKTGLLPTNRFAVADYTDVDGQRRSVAFPVPRIEVVAPTPTATATPLFHPLFLPRLALRDGAPDLALRRNCCVGTRAMQP